MEPGEIWNAALGVGKQAHDLGAGQMVARALVIYLVTLVIIRIGKKRFMSRVSAFDTVVGITIGSIAGRAITGSAPMVPSMASCAAIVALHWLLSWIALRQPRLGGLIKGSPVVLIENGRADTSRLRGEHMSDRDLEEDLRGKGLTGCETIKEGRLERNGRLSVIRKPAAPRVIEFAVHDGVQTVRVELGSS